MSRPTRRSRTRSTTHTTPTAATASLPPTGPALRPDSPSPAPPDPGEHLRRLAELVAAGEAEVPPDLDCPGRAAFEAAVRRLRRGRLVAFVARQVALDVVRSDAVGGAGAGQT